MVKIRGAVHVAVVRHAYRRHATLIAFLHEIVDLCHSIEHGKLSVVMEMDKSLLPQEVLLRTKRLSFRRVLSLTEDTTISGR